MSFIDKLERAWSRSDSLLCVGLDTDITKIPDHLAAGARPFFEFNKAIIAATADLVCAYKLQIAYYSAHRAEAELEDTIKYIVGNHPDAVIILDSKRADIGSTSQMYALEAFDRYGADALTVNPYFGGDSLAPFLDRRDRGVIILCRTTNPGAGEIQDLQVGDRKLYQVVAQRAASVWNYNHNVSLVVGATYPEELREVRSIVADMPLLIPGIGAQGGDLEAAVVHGMDSAGAGMIINASRSIIYAGDGKNFDQAARKVAQQLKDKINKYRKVVAG